MFPLRDENPHAPGFRPIVTYALIIANVIVFFIEVAYTGQIIDFTNGNAFSLFYNWHNFMVRQAKHNDNPWVKCQTTRSIITSLSSKTN